MTATKRRAKRDVRLTGAYGHFVGTRRGEIFGRYLAVTRRLRGDGNGYVITHVPTGMIAAGPFTLAVARRIAERLSKLDIPWKLRDGKALMPYADVAREAVNEVRDAPKRAKEGT